jgi:predicted ATPase
LSNDGRDLAAALQTIREMDEAAALDRAIEDAFPGAKLEVTQAPGARFGIELQQHGLLRPLAQAELSDGTLRYLLWIAVLLTPKPPALMVLNEPETSLHPDLFPALGRLILKASERGQVWVVTHSPLIREMLERAPGVTPIGLEKDLGETSIAGQSLIARPAWTWPKR